MVANFGLQDVVPNGIGDMVVVQNMNNNSRSRINFICD
jgi:hypothetical protein